MDLAIVLHKEHFLYGNKGGVNQGLPHPPMPPLLRDLLYHVAMTPSAPDTGGQHRAGIPSDGQTALSTGLKEEWSQSNCSLGPVRNQECFKDRGREDCDGQVLRLREMEVDTNVIRKSILGKSKNKAHLRTEEGVRETVQVLRQIMITYFPQKLPWSQNHLPFPDLAMMKVLFLDSWESPGFL